MSHEDVYTCLMKMLISVSRGCLKCLTRMLKVSHEDAYKCLMRMLISVS